MMKSFSANLTYSCVWCSRGTYQWKSIGDNDIQKQIISQITWKCYVKIKNFLIILSGGHIHIYMYVIVLVSGWMFAGEW